MNWFTLTGTLVFEFKKLSGDKSRMKEKVFYMAEQKREYFRVEFPRSYHPSLELDMDSYEIQDVSEFGVKFKVVGDNPFMTDELVVANIIFPDEEKFELSGQIVRIDGDYVSMELASPLPLHKIRAVHLYLIRNHMV